MLKPYYVSPDIAVIPSFFPILNMGSLAINAFVIKAKEPVLIDAGMSLYSDDFMKALATVIDPKDLKWIWLTHDDADHLGSLQAVMQAAPNAKLVANSLAVLRLNTVWSIPFERTVWLNHGDSLEVGDRTLTAIKPPLFDNPTTTGLFDGKSNALFSGDFFGAIIPKEVENIEELHQDDLIQGLLAWASLDSPWVHLLDPKVFSESLIQFRKLNPTHILSAHLPPAKSKIDWLLDVLEPLPKASPLSTPDQSILDQILALQKGA